MAKTAGLHSYGATLGYAPYVQPEPPALDPFTAIAEVIDIRGPNIEIGDTKMSHLLSPDKFHEYIPGFGEGDVVELTLNYEKTQVTTLYGLIPAAASVAPDYGRYRWNITMADDSVIAFEGYLKGLGNEIPDDDRITNTVRIKVSGKPTFTAGA